MSYPNYIMSSSHSQTPLHNAIKAPHQSSGGGGGECIPLKQNIIHSKQTSIEQSTTSEEQKTACAACKHQRKRCEISNCIFYPYFPSENREEFKAVHQIFGVMKVKKMLENCHTESERRRRAEEIKWVANMLTKPPSEGLLIQFQRLFIEIRRKDEVINELRNKVKFCVANNVVFCRNCVRVFEPERDSLRGGGGSNGGNYIYDDRFWSVSNNNGGQIFEDTPPAIWSIPVTEQQRDIRKFW